MHSVYFNFGDWAAATRLLSLTEKAIYFELLAIYYEQEAPIKQVQCTRIARAYARADAPAYADEVQAALQFVLETFFVQQGDEYVNVRCEEQIADFRRQSETKRNAAKARWSRVSSAKQPDAETAQPQSNSNAGAMQVQSTCNADAMQAISHKPEAINTPPSGERATRRKQFVPEEVGLLISEQEWQDFLAVRKAKRAPLTPTAWERLKREAGLAGITLSDALGLCVSKGWTSIDHNWESLRQGRKMSDAEIERLWGDASSEKEVACV